MSGMEHKCNNIIVLVLFILCLSEIVDGRELRPSDHGLAYQDSSSTPGTQTFFNGQTMKPLPLAAKNVTEWWRSGRGKDKASSPRDEKRSNKSSNGREDHVRVILLLASLVCGVIGVALLLTSVLIYLFRYRRNNKQKQLALKQQQQQQQQQENDG